MPDDFYCRITDTDMVRACAPEQPSEVKVGQRWMRADGETTLPVKRIRADAPLGPLYDLGSDSLTVVVGERTLREEWVCVDPPDNVTVLR